MQGKNSMMIPETFSRRDAKEVQGNFILWSTVILVIGFVSYLVA
jgi:hypothetical protein